MNMQINVIVRERLDPKLALAIHLDCDASFPFELFRLPNDDLQKQSYLRLIPLD